jgi:hypothetical protein
VCVLGACPFGAVVVVSEVPWCAWLDGLLALGAVDVACCYLGLPLLAEFAVFVSVAALFSAASCAFGFCLVCWAVATCCRVGASCPGADALGSWHGYSSFSL